MDVSMGGSWLPYQWSQSSMVVSCCVVTFVGAIGWRSLRKHVHRRPAQSTSMEKQVTEDADVIVVGAGVVGNAMAISLARDGRRVVLVERDWSEPDRIVGELLQPGGFKVLKHLGLEGSLEGTDCHRTHGYVIHNCETKEKVDIPYPVDNDGAPIEGRAFHHGRFISGLRRLAKEETLVQPVHGSVTSLLREDNAVRGVVCRLKDSDSTVREYRAPLTVVADGCFSNLRKSLVSTQVQSRSHFVGMVMHNCPQYRAHFAEVTLASPAPVLMYQISSTSTRVLVDIPGAKLPSDVKGYLNDSIAPQLPDHLRGPFLEAVATQPVRSMPNSFLPAAAVLQEGVIVLGDAYNMRHPLTGAGMSVGLHDVEFWKRSLRDTPDLHDAHALLQSQKMFHWHRKTSHAFTTNCLAQALYALFAAGDDDGLRSLRRACFRYFFLGGDCTAGPVSLLSILQPNPWTLVRHYFSVCAYGVYLDTCDLPLWKRPMAPWIAARLVWASLKVAVPLALSEMHRPS